MEIHVSVSSMPACCHPRIGQRSVAGSATRLLFTTAGILLEDIRVNGAAALTDLKCVVFDEVRGIDDMRGHSAHFERLAFRFAIPVANT